MSDERIVAESDKSVVFAFPFGGYTWTFVVRATARVCGAPRVDVFEGDDHVGVGYLNTECGPMFDGSDQTPLGGKSLYTEEGEAIGDNEHLWGEVLGKIWGIVRPEYERVAEEQRRATGA